MFFTAENIKNALAKTLPGSTSHRKMLPLNRDLNVSPNDIKKIKNSSVLLLLFVENNELTACLIKRPAHMKHHAGQIALPGGRLEEGETALDTALRETWEEIGIPQDKIEILGKLSELYVEVSRFQIHPFVGWLDEKPVLTINKNEVEKVIFFPIKNLNNPVEEITLQSFTGEITVPCTTFNREIIWGATAMILTEFYDVLNHFSNG